MGDDAGPETAFPDIPPKWRRKPIPEDQRDPSTGYVTEAFAHLSASGPPHREPPDPNPWIFRHSGPPFELRVTQGSLHINQIAPGSDSYILSESDAPRHFLESGEFTFTNEDSDVVAILRVADQNLPVILADEGDIEGRCAGGCWGYGRLHGDTSGDQ